MFSKGIMLCLATAVFFFLVIPLCKRRFMIYDMAGGNLIFAASWTLPTHILSRFLFLLVRLRRDLWEVPTATTTTTVVLKIQLFTLLEYWYWYRFSENFPNHMHSVCGQGKERWVCRCGSLAHRPPGFPIQRRAQARAARQRACP